MKTAWEQLTNKQKEDLEKEVRELFEWEHKQREQMQKQLVDEEKWVGGLDGNQEDYAPIIAERNRRFCELQKKYGFK